MKLFSELISFTEKEFKSVRTIEWEEIIYFKNMIITPIMLGPKDERPSSGQKRDLILTETYRNSEIGIDMQTFNLKSEADIRLNTEAHFSSSNLQTE